MRYEFIKEKHKHLLDGKELTGCTTILSVIAKPALIQWAANMAIGYVKEHKLGSPIKGIEEFILTNDTLLEEARTAHCRRKKEAGDYGTKTHEEIEKLVSEAISGNDGMLKDVKTDNKSIQNFIAWAKDNKVKFIESEKNVYSEPMFVGGIVDLVCEIDGQRWIGDIKTSGSGIYPEHMFQCAGYDLMLQDMGEKKADGYLILNLKESGEMIEKRNISNEENQEAFKSCLNLYRTLEKLKKVI